MSNKIIGRKDFEQKLGELTIIAKLMFVDLSYRLLEFVQVSIKISGMWIEIVWTKNSNLSMRICHHS